jgi:membrane protease YdiL (CAAX protease family)
VSRPSERVAEAALPAVSTAVGARVAAFFVLAFGITWALDTPAVLSALEHAQPAVPLMALAGLGAFGPTLAALGVSWRTGEVRPTFGRWRTPLVWIPAALGVTPALHLVATLIEVALGGHPKQWFYPPVQAEHIAGLLFFSLGEEAGWRGYAYLRLADSLGAVRGALIVGSLWALWHMGMWVIASNGAPQLSTVGFAMLELTAASVYFAWFFERSGRSLAVAIALHAGGHLDNVSRAPEDELRLRALRLVVYAAAAALAAWSLSRRPRIG